MPNNTPSIGLPCHLVLDLDYHFSPLHPPSVYVYNKHESKTPAQEDVYEFQLNESLDSQNHQLPLENLKINNNKRPDHLLIHLSSREEDKQEKNFNLSSQLKNCLSLLSPKSKIESSTQFKKFNSIKILGFQRLFLQTDHLVQQRGDLESLSELKDFLDRFKSYSKQIIFENFTYFHKLPKASLHLIKVPLLPTRVKEELSIQLALKTVHAISSLNPSIIQSINLSLGLNRGRINHIKFTTNHRKSLEPLNITLNSSFPPIAKFKSLEEKDERIKFLIYIILKNLIENPYSSTDYLLGDSKRKIIVTYVRANQLLGPWEKMVLTIHSTNSSNQTVNQIQQLKFNQLSHLKL